MKVVDPSSRHVQRLMLLYALFSGSFGFSYIFGRQPVWISFWLHQAEAVLFLIAAAVVPRATVRWRPVLLSVFYVSATALIVPAAHLAGENQFHFLSVLPLLVALTNPEHPLPTFAAGVSSFVGTAALLVVYGGDTHPLYSLGTVVVIVAGATYGVHRLAGLRKQLDQVRSLQSALVQKERLAALGEAAAVVAHEVRNPLGAIANAVALVRKRSVEEPERLLNMIDEEIGTLDRLVHDLLVLARPLNAEKRPTDIGEFVKRCARVAGGATDQVRIVAPEAEAPVAAADPDLLQLAVVNLLRNALQASPPDEQVVVSYRSQPTVCVIAVDDHGPGLPPEIRERLFEPFVTTRSLGTGLGLAIAKRVVEAHDGRISAGPGPDGRGTRFEIVLPREGVA